MNTAEKKEEARIYQELTGIKPVTAERKTKHTPPKPNKEQLIQRQYLNVNKVI
jgi:hypothetical protein